MCYVLPAIIHRFESYLISLEACHALDLDISPALALEALTKDSDNSEEHGEEQINFKSGMGANYERLEFCTCPPSLMRYSLLIVLVVGDCFLKMATSISVFVQQPDENEFEFHVRRMEMLCNKNLMETAVGKKKDQSADDPERDLKLYNYIRTEAFSRYVLQYFETRNTNIKQSHMVSGRLKAYERKRHEQERGRLAQAHAQSW